jgi:hypothetical protein
MQDVNLPNTHAQQLIGFCDFYNRIKRILSRPGGLFSMTYGEKHFLYELSESNDLLATTAQSILDFTNNATRHIDGMDYIMPDGTIRQMQVVVSDDNPVTIELKVYPNPANSIINVEYKLSETYSSASISLLDVSGRRIQNYNVSGNLLTITPYALSNGIYFITLTVDGKQLKTQKLIYAK